MIRAGPWGAVAFLKWSDAEGSAFEGSDSLLQNSSILKGISSVLGLCRPPLFLPVIMSECVIGWFWPQRYLSFAACITVWQRPLLDKSDSILLSPCMQIGPWPHRVSEASMWPRRSRGAMQHTERIRSLGYEWERGVVVGTSVDLGTWIRFMVDVSGDG